MKPCDYKKAYDKKGAQTMLNYRAECGDRNLRIYQCPCGFWHLTHKPAEYGGRHRKK